MEVFMAADREFMRELRRRGAALVVLERRSVLLLGGDSWPVEISVGMVLEVLALSTLERRRGLTLPRRLREVRVGTAASTDSMGA